MPVSDESLVTLDGAKNILLRSDAEDKLAEQVFDDSGQWSDEGIRLLEESSEHVKNHLNRRLLVDTNKALLRSMDWCRSDRTPNDDYLYRLKLHHVNEWPVLWTDEDTIIYGDRYIFAKDRLNSVNYIAGYRREGQDQLSDFSSDIEDNLNSVDDIPTLPQDIIGVSLRIAVYWATQQIKGLVGMSESIQNIGSNMRATIQKTSLDEKFVSNQLMTLLDYKFYA